MFKLNMYHDTSSQESPHLLSRHLQLSKSFEAIRWQRHSFPSPHRWMDLWLEHVGICWKSDFAKSNITNILQYLTITNQYPSSTRFMLVNLSVDAQVHGRNHCIWSTSALCAQDLLGILGCFLDVCYNQCLPCNQINQVLQSRWKIRGQNSGTHRCTNECRQTNAAAKLHNSFATPLVLRLCQKSKTYSKIFKPYQFSSGCIQKGRWKNNEKQNRDTKDLVTPIPIGSQKVLQICGTFWQGTSRSDKTEFVNCDAVNCSDINLILIKFPWCPLSQLDLELVGGCSKCLKHLGHLGSQNLKRLLSSPHDFPAEKSCLGSPIMSHPVAAPWNLP